MLRPRLARSFGLSRLRATAFALTLCVGMFAGPAVGSAHAAAPSTTASAASFLTSSVLPSIDAFWRQESRASRVAYSPPRVVLFDAAHPAFDACGDGEPIGGHAYCPADRTIYLDVGTAAAAAFGRLWATDSNFTIVTVVAHEWGHAIQDQRRARGDRLSRVETEQQADCLAGAFARYAEAQGWLEPGDLQAAMALSLRSGDGAHGPGWSRALAFSLGYDSPVPAATACGLK